MKKDLTLSAVAAGLIAVLISYAGPLVIVFQAAKAAQLSGAQLSSWIWAISIGSGLTGIALSLRYRTPVINAWSTPGAALLAGTLGGIGYPEAVGAFLLSAMTITLLGFSGLFDRILRLVPQSLAAAMLAGILFHFGADVFLSVRQQPVLAGSMLAAYLVLKRVTPRYAIAGVLMLGCAVAAWRGQIALASLHFSLATPVFTAPQFSLGALVGVGVPLCIVTITGQYVPGIAVLRGAGYQTPSAPLVGWTGLASILLAPFGSHGLNLAAITAAICTGREAHEDPSKRYVAGVACGAFYLVIGSFGATLSALFFALPKELVACIAGLALFGAIMNSLGTAMAIERQRESALITFLVTASGVTWFGLGAAFWGLLLGALANWIWNGRTGEERTGQPASAEHLPTPAQFATKQ